MNCPLAKGYSMHLHGTLNQAHDKGSVKTILLNNQLNYEAGWPWDVLKICKKATNFD